MKFLPNPNPFEIDVALSPEDTMARLENFSDKYSFLGFLNNKNPVLLLKYNKTKFQLQKRSYNRNPYRPFMFGEIEQIISCIKYIINEKYF